MLFSNFANANNKLCESFDFSKQIGPTRVWSEHLGSAGQQISHYWASGLLCKSATECSIDSAKLPKTISSGTLNQFIANEVCQKSQAPVQKRSLASLQSVAQAIKNEQCSKITKNGGVAKVSQLNLAEKASLASLSESLAPPLVTFCRPMGVKTSSNTPCTEYSLAIVSQNWNAKKDRCEITMRGSFGVAEKFFVTGGLIQTNLAFPRNELKDYKSILVTR